MITEKGITEHLNTPMTVRVYDELASTNTTAKELGREGSLSEVLVVARRQSGGRGRLGRRFFSPEGGLYMSLLLRPRMPASKSLNITTAAAVAVCRAVESMTDKRCEIKWVNDVYIAGRKVCGILTESAVDVKGELAYAVLGIGVNLVSPANGFPEDIRDLAGTVFGQLADGDADRLAAAIVNEFMSLYSALPDPSIYIDEYRRRSYLIGREINVMRIHDGASRQATAVAIDNDLGLVVRYPDGTTEVLSSGDVSVKG